jgi:hypothetical protein
VIENISKQFHPSFGSEVGEIIYEGNFLAIGQRHITGETGRKGILEQCIMGYNNKGAPTILMSPPLSFNR